MTSLREANSTAWLGPVGQRPVSGGGDRAAFMSYVYDFKNADFSRKRDFFRDIAGWADEELRCLAIRLSCSICSHLDLRSPESFAFLTDLTDREAFAFGAVAHHALCVDIVPYLLVLADTFDGSAAAETLRHGIDRIVPYESEIGEDASLALVEEFVTRAQEGHDPSIYYLGRSPARPALICQRVLRVAADRQGTTLGLADEPTLLSIWSGSLCPIDFRDVVDDAAHRRLIDYVDGLSARKWTPGAKYFYGHPVPD